MIRDITIPEAIAIAEKDLPDRSTNLNTLGVRSRGGSTNANSLIKAKPLIMKIDDDTPLARQLREKRTKELKDLQARLASGEFRDNKNGRLDLLEGVAEVEVKKLGWKHPLEQKGPPPAPPAPPAPEQAPAPEPPATEPPAPAVATEPAPAENMDSLRKKWLKEQNLREKTNDEIKQYISEELQPKERELKLSDRALATFYRNSDLDLLTNLNIALEKGVITLSSNYSEPITTILQEIGCNFDASTSGNMFTVASIIPREIDKRLAEVLSKDSKIRTIQVAKTWADVVRAKILRRHGYEQEITVNGKVTFRNIQFEKKDRL